MLISSVPYLDIVLKVNHIINFQTFKARTLLKYPQKIVRGTKFSFKMPLFNEIFLKEERTAVVQWTKHSDPDWRVRIRGSYGKAPPCTLLAPEPCKIRHWCNVL